MDIRIKRRGVFVKRIMARARIDDVLIKEDMVNPDMAKIHLYFKGGRESGILTLDKKEFDMLVSSVRPGLVKKSKKIN